MDIGKDLQRAYDDGYEHGKQGAMKWIPVTERLPVTNGEYLVKVGASYKPIRIYEYKPTDWGDRNENLWIGNGGNYCFNWFVEYWMPLPKPPKDGA